MVTFFKAKQETDVETNPGPGPRPGKRAREDDSVADQVQVTNSQSLDILEQNKGELDKKDLMRSTVG